MNTRTTPLRALEGPGSAQRARQLQRRFRQAERQAARGPLARLGRRLLVAYWAACLTVIALGLDSLYPDVRPALAARFTPTAQAPAGAAAVPSDTPMETAPLLERTLPPPQPAPAPDLTRPFRTCAAAHAAGVYDIPADSPAYSPHQDGDGDGLACEPY